MNPSKLKAVRSVLIALIVIAGLAVSAIAIIGPDKSELDLVLMFFGNAMTATAALLPTVLKDDSKR